MLTETIMIQINNAVINLDHSTTLGNSPTEKNKHFHPVRIAFN